MDEDKVLYSIYQSVVRYQMRIALKRKMLRNRPKKEASK